MRPPEGIVTDGSHLSKPGISAYRALDLKTGEELFREEIGNQTVNIAEFLGVVQAIKHIIENNFTPPVIYTDSMTAITWVRNKETASKKNNLELRKAEIFLKAMEEKIKHIQIHHWSNEAWGENPADFGYKK